MHDSMMPDWEMGAPEWFELAGFVLLLLVVAGLLVQYLSREPAAVTRAQPASGMTGWHHWPEVRLVTIALPLELLWEIAQFPLYDVWHQNDWGYILYGLAHCTLGDLLILLVIYELVALLSRNRAWYAATGILPRGLLFTLLGVGYTIFSEIMNVRLTGTWGYTELMPIVPVVEIGATPFLQWLLIPPVLLWLMRGTTPSPQGSH
ncbi:hypothetical protein [Thiohalophilus sp.]|uniref:hypothetical protein n=1 Tax=Thiohalophilus sp. TaxID=3028392 RepID=UPI002ACD857C|nr:hypothetical protein [Thiohalophilus sp.]MDZ7662986.1 hypothetical protein [Thiohalophilus sp.]